MVACEACDGAGTLTDDANDLGDGLAESAPDDHMRRLAMAPPASTPCWPCDGRGWQRVESTIFPGAMYRTTCRGCEGSGVPAAAFRPAA